MKTLTVEGSEYKKYEYLKFQHSMGAYCWIVYGDDGKERAVIRFPGGKEWKFWTVNNRLGRQ